MKKITALSNELSALLHSVSTLPSRRLLLAISVELKKRDLDARITAIKTLFSSEALRLFPDFQQRLSVLVRLKYIDEHHAVQLKGRVASEVNTCDELILTELIFENVSCGVRC